jgi:hypothetical protein
MEASETTTAGLVPITYLGPKDANPAHRHGALHVHHDDGSETVLPHGVKVLVTPEIAEQLSSDENQAVYLFEQGGD